MNEDDNDVAYIYSANLVHQLNKIPKYQGRAQLVNSLMSAYNLFDHLKIINPIKADEKLLKTFHSQEYIDHLKKCSTEDDEEKIFNETEDDFGIGYDCEYVEDLFELCSSIGGSSVTAAQLINNNSAKYAVNWFGGWHHAKRDRASGFCYVNDINLCILKLRQRFQKILYIDLDMHHGDGVQDAFEYTNKVMTLSFHKFQPGFFPGTGNIDEIGKGNGQNFTVNMPLNSGIDDEMFYNLFGKIFKRIIEVYQPEVMVTQCGADSLYGDPIDQQNPFNLTVDGYCKCIKDIIDTKLPTIFLGGGGYNFANTARLWCSIVALLTKKELKNDIPEHDNFLEYGPDYELSTTSGLIRNKNSPDYISNVLTNVIQNLNNVRF